MAQQADVVARYAGGDNAGHTIVIGDRVFKLHLLPTGVLHPDVVSVIGNGTVINPQHLVTEITQLRDAGLAVSPQRLMISASAHLITPAHIAYDRIREQARGGDAIGTTLRGIGPAYSDKIGRTGLRMGDSFDMQHVRERLEAALQQADSDLQANGLEPLADDALESTLHAVDMLRPFVADTTDYLYHRLQDGAHVVCEGAQGSLLDIDHGNYPYVTSSSPTIGGVITGLGIAPQSIERIIGVTKVFSTRVGNGPMPTELFDETGDRLRGTGENQWDEYGTTTGRARRCGWLDGVLLRYATRLNGCTELVLTKLDILSGFDELRIATAYTVDGETIDRIPLTTRQLDGARPVYRSFAGWQEDITGVREFEALPKAAQAYIGAIIDWCDLPVTSVSVGPEREQVIAITPAHLQTVSFA